MLPSSSSSRLVVASSLGEGVWEREDVLLVLRVDATAEEATSAARQVQSPLHTCLAATRIGFVKMLTSICHAHLYPLFQHINEGEHCLDRQRSIFGCMAKLQHRFQLSLDACIGHRPYSD